MTGPMVPVALSNAVPETLKQPVFGTPIWKIFAVFVMTIVTALLLLFWHRVTAHPASGGLVGVHGRLLLSPLSVLLSGVGLRYFFPNQIVVAGQFAAAAYVGADPRDLSGPGLGVLGLHAGHFRDGNFPENASRAEI